MHTQYSVVVELAIAVHFWRLCVSVCVCAVYDFVCDSVCVLCVCCVCACVCESVRVCLSA